MDAPHQRSRFCCVDAPQTPPSSSLKCYTCVGQSSNDQCLTSRDCTQYDNYCMTMKTSILGAMSLSKSCMMECTESSTSGVSVSCCQSDLCNGAAGMRLNNIMLLAGIVATSAILFL